MNDKPNEELVEVLAGLEPPPPPKELRARALEAARNASDAGSRPDVWSAIWSSPGIRLAWAASVVALAAGHLLLGPGNAVTSDPDPKLTASNGIDRQLTEFVRPVNIANDARSMIGATTIDPSLIFELKGNPS